ncbi:MAG: hypothetical protein QNK89_10120, partial [Lacinutrix sp.]|uniref:hypothetical protein n=1 Tax=Lacinutrix sp. TaxID=1937692 RepID=UPI0030AAF343
CIYIYIYIEYFYLYLIDGVFDGVRSIESSIHDYERREPTKDIPGFEGTLEALNGLTIFK